jgi:hypothetical protein
MVNTRLVFAFPVVLSVGVLLIPIVSDYTDHTAAAAAAQESRWLVGHLVAAVSFGLAAAAAAEIGRWISASGPGISYRIAVPLMAVGAGLHAAGLGADGIGPVAAASPVEFFDRSGRYVVPVFVVGAASFSVGLIALTATVRRRGLLSTGLGWIVFFASIVFAVAEAIPSGWGLYVVAAASWVVFWPLARSMRTS